MRTRVKICGFTRVEDAVCAAHLGVDAIGLVFYPPSTRNVDIDQAIAIVNALPAFITTVGLFVDEQEARIREVLSRVSIDCLQFHGDEPPEACERYGKPYIKAISMRDGVDVDALSKLYDRAAGLLLDAYHPGLKGGSGNRFDWDLIPCQCAKSIVLAGGLDPSNVLQAITNVQPYAVDVSSGVESEKGIKDAAKMKAFMRIINEGNSS